MGLIVEPSLGQVSYPVGSGRPGIRRHKDVERVYCTRNTISSAQQESCKAAETASKSLLWELAFVTWLPLNLINNQTHTHTRKEKKNQSKRIWFEFHCMPVQSRLPHCCKRWPILRSSLSHQNYKQRPQNGPISSSSDCTRYPQMKGVGFASFLNLVTVHFAWLVCKFLEVSANPEWIGF